MIETAETSARVDESAAISAAPLRRALSATEVRRRLWHMSPGALPFLLWIIPHPDPGSIDFLIVLSLIAVGIGAAVYRHYARIRRDDHDSDRLGAVFGYMIPVVVLLVVFRYDAELGLTTLAILAFGDGSATLGGLLFGGPKLPWNTRKSWSGLFSFLIFGTAVATIVYWGESNNRAAENVGATWLLSCLCAGGATLAAAIAESIPTRINDNVRVGLAASITLVVLHATLVRHLMF
jgi:phytol kinase